MTDNKTPFYQKALLVALGLFTTVVVLEASLRLGGFIVLSLQEYRNLQSIRHGGTYRILCLGESTTQGQYPPFLEDILNQRYSGARFSVIDGGVRGVKTPNILAELEGNLDKYRPAMVIAMMGINDQGTHIPYESLSGSKTARFLKSFRTYKLARLLWLHIRAQDIQHPKKAVKPVPQDERACVKLGKLYREQGKISQAEDAFKKAIALNPQNERAYVELGRLYREQGQFSRIEELLKKALESNPRNAGVYARLGGFYRDQGKFSQAEEAYGKAIELDPQNERIYIELGWFYRAQGKFSQAEKAFKQAIALKPQNNGAYIVLGWFYRDQGKLSQAEGAFKKAIELEPQHNGTYGDQAYGALSVVYEETGKPELARVYAEKAAKLRSEQFNSVTVQNYLKLKDILDKQGIRLVCAQYPLHNIGPLKKMFEGRSEGVVFVDNEKTFRDAVNKEGYAAYFTDMFAGDFGHCTAKGNRLLAENIASAILKEVFHK